MGSRQVEVKKGGIDSAKLIYKNCLAKRIYKYTWYYLLALPGICVFLLFHYAPMYGIAVVNKISCISASVKDYE